MTRTRSRFIAPGFLIIEFISITFAAFLGFLLTEWRTSQAQAQQAEGALKAIATEVSFNERQFSTRTSYYKRVVAEFDSLQAAGTRVRIEDLREWRGAAPPLMRDASYKAALSTGALSHIPFETANALATAYAVQDYVQTPINSVMGNFMSPQAMDPETVQFTFNVFLDLEPEILGAFREVGTNHLHAFGYEASGAD
ncbi:MAG: hypothetical protein ACPGQT_01870 [Rhodothermales bacterium]